MHDYFKNAPQIEAIHLFNASAQLGEGPVWDDQEQHLLWVDINSCMLHIYNPQSKSDLSLFTKEKIGTVVPASNRKVITALKNGIYILDLQNGRQQFICNPNQISNLRYNDGKCDPSGRFWVGTISQERKPEATLYRLDHNLQIKPIIQNVTNSNGIAWSHDAKSMYYIDTPTQSVQAFDFHNDTGEINNGRTIITIPREMGSPDGMTIDIFGNLWIALYGGGSVVCYNPANAEILKVIRVPVPNTTSCTFGGSRLDTLFITTAREGLGKHELKKFKKSGDLFYVKPGIKGVPVSRWTG